MRYARKRGARGAVLVWGFPRSWSRSKLTQDVGCGPEQPLVIVGAGPVGMRAASELARRCPGREIVIFGEEDAEPYDRVQLSSFLMGEVPEETLFQQMWLSQPASITYRLGMRVTAIDRERKLVRDSRGGQQGYSTLILATGSTP